MKRHSELTQELKDQGWTYDTDGDIEHPEWQYDTDGDYRPKSGHFNIDSDFYDTTNYNQKITSIRQHNEVKNNKITPKKIP